VERGLTKNQVIAEIGRSTHGDYKAYVKTVQAMSKEEPEFMAHLLAWNHQKGQIRDSKVAFPVIMLTTPNLHEEFADNAAAHLAKLGPREMLKALRFALEIRPKGNMSLLKWTVRQYLLEQEKNWPKWERTMLLHRATLKELFSLVHLAPAKQDTHSLLWGFIGGGKTGRPKIYLTRPGTGLFAIVDQLRSMEPQEAAGAILEHKIPFLVAQGALGAKAKSLDVVLALIKTMTPTELITNTKALERLGVKTVPALRGAYEEALGKAAKSTKNLLKTTTAVEALEDEGLKEKLRGVQERQMEKIGVEGNWLVIGDKSSSMTVSIDVARQVAGTLAATVKGQVLLVFVDTSPRGIEVTGKPLDWILNETKHLSANGNTCLGCGIVYAHERGFLADGIVLVSDGGENTNPSFTSAYAAYAEKLAKKVPVYLYRLAGDPDRVSQNMKVADFDVQLFDFTGTHVDYYSLPNLIATMRTNRYSLLDEIMETRLLKLEDVFSERKIHATV
jgi:hypothetical protein